MKGLIQLINNNEDWLMEQILMYARKYDFTKYTSTLKEAWRLSISGLSEAVTKAGNRNTSDVEMHPDEDYHQDPIAAFGIKEAKLHRERGIDFGMFLALYKYYLQCYTDLIDREGYSTEIAERYKYFITRVFNRIEIGFCVEWANLSGQTIDKSLREKNRMITNEKNMFLTIAESIGSAVMLFDAEKKIKYLNHSAANLFGLSNVPGSYYYSDEVNKASVPDWLKPYIAMFFSKTIDESKCEFTDSIDGKEKTFLFHFKRMLDISSNSQGVVLIMHDITQRKIDENKLKQQKEELEKALGEIKQLQGIIPICAHCKKIRSDTGYWEQVEEYITEKSGAKFSHGLCPDCAKELYPDLS